MESMLGDCLGLARALRNPAGSSSPGEPFQVGAFFILLVYPGDTDEYPSWTP